MRGPRHHSALPLYDSQNETPLLYTINTLAAAAVDLEHSIHVLKHAFDDDSCSGNGACQSTTGECLCQQGHWGPACQYKQCPSATAIVDLDDSHGMCSGHGTLKELIHTNTQT